MVLCTFAPETQIFFFLGGGPNFLPVGNLSPRTLPRSCPPPDNEVHKCICCGAPRPPGERRVYVYLMRCPPTLPDNNVHKYIWCGAPPSRTTKHTSVFAAAPPPCRTWERSRAKISHGQKVRPPPKKKKEFGFLGQKCKKPLPNKGLGARKQPKNKDSVGFIRFFDSANRKCL